jgi:hypothetical protein
MDQEDKKMKTNDWNKRKQMQTLLVFLAVLFAVLLPKGFTARVYGSVSAPSGTVTNLRQTGATTDSVDIQFGTTLESGVQYAIEIKTNTGSVYTECMTVSGGKATISGLDGGSIYYVKVVPFNEEIDMDTGDVIKKILGTESTPISVATAPEKAPDSVTQTDSGTDSVTISWKPVSGASGYIVEYFLTESSSASPVRESLTTTSTSAVLTGLSATKTYTATVTPYRESPEGYRAYDSSVYASNTHLAIGQSVSGTPQGTVTGFVQEKASADSAEISFKLPDKKAQYSVQLSTSKDGEFTEHAIATEEKVSLTELKAATSYYVRVVPFYQKWNAFNEVFERTYGTASEAFEIVTAPNAKPKKITQTAATVTGFTVFWDAVDGVSGYYVEYYCAGSTKKTTKKVTKNQIKLTGLTKNSEYNIFVTPYKKSAGGFVAMDETNYASVYNIPVQPSKAGKATVTKFWQSIGKVNLKTTKIACADGYQYVLYTAYSDKAQKIATTTSTAYSSADIKSTKLKKSAVFKVRVRAYITVEDKKVYGAWSDWTYISAPSEVTLSRNKAGIHAGWGKVKGADRYLVYISTDKTSGYKKCFVTTKTSCDITSYGKTSIKTGKKYYVYVIPQVKVSGKYVSLTKKDAVAAIK